MTKRTLPNERNSITHRFKLGEDKGYLIVGLFDDGTPGEITVRMSTKDACVKGLLDCLSISISMGLQHGVPLTDYVEKFCYTRFPPEGWTGGTVIRSASSIMDYAFQWIKLKFLQEDEK